MLDTDAFFQNVCELDLVFSFYKVRYSALLVHCSILTRCFRQVYAIMDEVFLAGEIEETSKNVVLVRHTWFLLRGFTNMVARRIVWTILKS